MTGAPAYIAWMELSNFVFLAGFIVYVVIRGVFEQRVKGWGPLSPEWMGSSGHCS